MKTETPQVQDCHREATQELLTPGLTPRHMSEILARRFPAPSDGWEEKAAIELIRGIEPLGHTLNDMVAGAAAIIKKAHAGNNETSQFPANGWQPIETAPTNESVLIFIPNAEHYGHGVYRGLQVDMGTGRRWSVSGLHMGRDCVEQQPTHWMPLPAAPQSPEEWGDRVANEISVSYNKASTTGNLPEVP